MTMVRVLIIRVLITRYPYILQGPPLEDTACFVLLSVTGCAKGYQLCWMMTVAVKVNHDGNIQTELPVTVTGSIRSEGCLQI
jgi:hypothetical protein